MAVDEQGSENAGGSEMFWRILTGFLMDVLVVLTSFSGVGGGVSGCMGLLFL